MTETQLKYIEVLRATGNPSRARAAAGVVRRTVSLWERDEQFAEAAEEAQAAALDEIVEASRKAALAGDSAQMTNWLKIARPELRPHSSVNVAVGVKTSRTEQLSDEELIAKAQRVLDDVALRDAQRLEYEARQTRQIGARDAIDVEVLPGAAVEPKPEPESASEPDEIDPEDLL